MATVPPPIRNNISGTWPNPSNGVARTAMGVLHDYLMNLLGNTGTPAAARIALGSGAVGDAVFLAATNLAAENAMGVTRNIAVNGYRKTGDSLIIQWGSTVAQTNAASALAISFPIAFPSSCATLIATNGDTSTSLAGVSSQITSLGGFNATYVIGASGVGTGVTVRCNWTAFGY